ncbi:lipopolysaccharide biosynthesis protein [Arcticibacter tournemirensis]|uniref:Lipopolysaccharide biosynthesis protein n=1 Tax=Arcticibacter tournemirensis TaxID=699437 RepID=A0A4Q0M8U9_9SPHI|nr:lipopolysaccharide biosynthesis protein [Arcticibacter tournemirensis]RXF69363.1 lipopolysaccharide biosynthesis protein [Arcticibacter tournemirensis]
MQSNSSSRIAKNTMMLYFRMMFQLVVALYTSKVILKALGQTDYGIYDVVGGVIIIVSFLNNAMALSSQRFITFYLGKKDIVLSSKVFSTALMVQIVVASFIVIIGETVGLWFFYNYMKIPDDRLFQASIVFHVSLLSSAISIIGIPYYATIIAHEKISFFSVISIVETSLKLIIALILPLFVTDRLVLYAVLMLTIVVIVRIIYSKYCTIYFKEVKFRFIRDKALFKEMMNFAGWSLAGNMSFVAYTQGTNILLNIFFGPVVNAARGIAFQVQGAISSFITNFQIAINPQIVKSYASRDYKGMHSLIFVSAKLSFLLMLLISLPVIVEMPFILSLWLGKYPQYSVIFCRLLLCSGLMTSLSNPLQIGINATGKIKKYNVLIGALYLSIIPISYVGLKLGFDAFVVFVVQLLILAISVFMLIRLCAEGFDLSIRKFILEVLARIVLVSILALLLPCALKFYMDEGWFRLVLIAVSSILYTIILIWYVGLTNEEKVIASGYYGKMKRRFIK